MFVVRVQPTRCSYSIRIHGIPITWRSEISAWDPLRRFVDLQRRGPYRRWVHTHTFEAVNGGTSVGDSVDFDVPLSLPGGWCGATSSGSSRSDARRCCGSSGPPEPGANRP